MSIDGFILLSFNRKDSEYQYYYYAHGDQKLFKILSLGALITTPSACSRIMASGYLFRFICIFDFV